MEVKCLLITHPVKAFLTFHQCLGRDLAYGAWHCLSSWFSACLCCHHDTWDANLSHMIKALALSFTVPLSFSSLEIVSTKSSTHARGGATCGEDYLCYPFLSLFNCSFIPVWTCVYLFYTLCVCVLRLFHLPCLRKSGCQTLNFASLDAAQFWHS